VDAAGEDSSWPTCGALAIDKEGGEEQSRTFGQDPRAPCF